MQRKYFFRANTSSGLVDHTESNILDVENLYVLNGKSSILKSRILKNLCKFVMERGIDTECVVSPFDISYLDAVILRNLKTAVIDNSCITGERKFIALDTDKFISNVKLEKYKESQNELFFRSAEAISDMYSAYKGGKIIHDEWEKIYIQNIDFERLNKFEDGLLDSLITKKSSIGRGKVNERFFGASTPDGSVNYIENLTDGLTNRYFIKGRPGTGKSTFMKKLLKKAVDYDYNCEVYYCSFDKDSLDMVLIPELSYCVFDSTAPHELFPSRQGDDILDFYVEAGLSGVDEKLSRELCEIKKRYAFRVNEGITKLRLACGYMHEAEHYFELSANCELADKATDKILRKILA